MTERWNFHVLGPFNTNAILYCALLAVGLVYYVMNRHRLKHTAGSRVYLLFVIYAIVPVLLAPQRAEALAAWTREAAMLALYFLFSNLLRERSEQRKYIGVVTALGILSVAVAIAQKAGLYPTFYGGRCASVFGHPAGFAYFLLIPIALASAFLMFGQSKLVRLGCITLLGISITGVVLSLTRGAWIAACAMFGVLGLFGRKWFMGVASVVLVATTLLAYPVIEERFHWVLDKSDIRMVDVNAVTSGRIAIWNVMVPLVKQKPLMGQGLQSFVFYSGGFDAHNGFLKLLFETGVIGLVLYCLFFVVNLGYAFKAWHRARDPFDKALSLALLSFYSVFLLSCLWENLFLGQGPQWFIYSAAGIMAGLAHQLEIKKPAAHFVPDDPVVAHA